MVRKSIIAAICIIGTVSIASAQQGNKNQGNQQPKQQPASSGSLPCNKTTKNFADCLACGQRHGWPTAQAGSHCRRVLSTMSAFPAMTDRGRTLTKGQAFFEFVIGVDRRGTTTQRATQPIPLRSLSASHPK